jgi:hypothetical protein
MHNIDIFVDGDDRDRKRRRGKWLLPLLVGVLAAFALGREKPSVAVRGAPASPPAGPAASSPPSPVRGAETAPGQPAGRRRSYFTPARKAVKCAAFTFVVPGVMTGSV